MIVAAGNFDGVHLGHAAVVRCACEQGLKRGEKTLVFTFSNHPRAFFGGDVSYIVPNEKRRRLLLSLGADEVYFQQFDADFAKKTPEEFISFLKEKFNCSAVVCGNDFRFGKGAAGSPQSVTGVEVITVPEIDIDGGRVSSTRIRSLLREGKIEEANRLLGYIYSISAPVLHGKHLGTSLGFPTLNQLPQPELLLPKNGVYITLVRCEGKRFYGVTNVGVRPSVDDGKALTVETFLVEPKPSDDLYGKEVEVFFRKRLRDEKQFPDLADLTKQIALDTTLARRYYDENNVNL